MVDRADSAIVGIFTDGAGVPNPGPGGWGAVFRYRGHEKERFGGEADRTTNNRMEQTAPIEALGSLTRPMRVLLYTDSKYVRDGVTKWLPKWRQNGWRTGNKEPVKNADLWRRLEAAAARHDVEWHWVKGHSGHVENERADRLAARGLAETLRAAGMPLPSAQGVRRDFASRPVAVETSVLDQPCGAVTRAGSPCAVPAGPSGFCHVHDPALQCGAITTKGQRCAVATGGGPCATHRDVDSTVPGLF
jgi:ribonuclease HI